MPDNSRVCVIIPTYNNARTVAQVVNAVLPYGLPVIVVNDGSTDSTTQELAAFDTNPDVTILNYSPNRGKGMALRTGFACAWKQQYTHALTLDSDGQHFATDIPAFLTPLAQHPKALLVGCRNLHQENMPSKNTFANKFSNFWFAVQTGRHLSDTQTGYRMYPLAKTQRIHWCCTRYESELEMLVRLTWRGVKPVEVPINVYYPPNGERVTHFRTKDFVRISILNTVLTIAAIVYGYPSMLIHKIIGD